METIIPIQPINAESYPVVGELFNEFTEPYENLAQIKSLLDLIMEYYHDGELPLTQAEASHSAGFYKAMVDTLRLIHHNQDTYKTEEQVGKLFYDKVFLEIKEFPRIYFDMCIYVLSLGVDELNRQAVYQFYSDLDRLINGVFTLHGVQTF